MIAVFGCGVIGEAFISAILKRSGCTETIRRIDPVKKYWVTDEQLNECTLAFICVPTPTASRVQDISIICSILDRLESIEYKGLVVLRSTITPNNVRILQGARTLRIATLPEFLTEANAALESNHPRFILVGTQSSQDFGDLFTNFLHKLWHPSANRYHHSTPAGAMLIKYWVNCTLASRVAQANEFKLYWDAVGDDPWEQVSRLFGIDHRCGSSHTKVPGPDGKLGFGGKCFPKDMEAMAGEIADVVEQWEGGVINGALEVNKRVRREDK